jgi:ABC-2 type transport system ATP-binding protein
MPLSGISIENIRYSYDPKAAPALKNINAKISPGKITGLVGPDGAGKTTLMRLMTGLLLPTQGKILVNGFDTQNNPEQIHNRLGYMPQKFGLYEDLTVIENLVLYADLRGLPKKDRPAIFDYFLKFTALSPFQKRLAGDLSGGMKQKLGLACALLKGPELLLLDEPSVGVDPISRRELWSIVKQMMKQGTTVVWSTSYLDEAGLCDEVLVLNEGKLLYKGIPEDLTKKVQGRVFETVKSPPHKRGVLQNLIKDKSIVDGLIKGDAIRLVMKEGAHPHKLSQKDIQWKQVEPIFEDGFIDLLGGVKERESAIAGLVAQVQLKDKNVILAEKLTKKFGDFTAVHNIDFTIQQGEIFGFLGPNGAGKSTTFKMLCGLLTPTSGHSSVIGYDIRQAPSVARRQIGYMAQKFSLYGNLTLYQNMAFFAGIYGLARTAQREAIDQMINAFGLEHYLTVPAEALPLGYKQRLALACSLMHRPPILFLDEPTSGVDPLTRREFWLHINGMVQKGVTIMVSTHFMGEAEYCDRLCLIYRGTIIALGTPDELKKKAVTRKGTIPTLEDTFIYLIQEYDQNEHR